MDLELQASVLRSVHRPERQPQLAATGLRAQLHTLADTLRRRQAMAGSRGLLRSRGRLGAPALEPGGSWQHHPELRAPEAGRGRAERIRWAILLAPDDWGRRHSREAHLGSDAARRK